MPRSGTKYDHMRKISLLAVFANAVQILCAIAILLYVVFSDSFNIPEHAEIALVAVSSGIVIWGAIVDIRDAFVMKRVEMQNQMLEEAYKQLEDLNSTLRKQRHDFKNHLQVVYTLTEMAAYSDVQDYVQRIYEDVQSVGRLIRTAVPAVNALISAKAADCSEKGIRFDTEIQSSWEEIPVAGWELCRIIGNFIDNAADALIEKMPENPYIRIVVGETLTSWILSVENNGPEIPHEHKRNIFLPGFTTKSAGHGNGLSIVSDLVEKYHGNLEVESSSGITRFGCSFPKPEAHQKLK